ncbi:hypothetical protein [Alkalinema sp. FACHB-956]|uniref:hypothetical protein n=1 Tax=Alkalinema sp. FACHB-956 TaxID=2692768 RepID=UPI001684E064|nr:hypothetical protein [Alkalinema sp. FACHB-956]MBD2325605.1 hypothetical protein [Alkalinema sp. FACHB-956]
MNYWETNTDHAEPIPSVTLHTATQPEQEGEWLRQKLHRWLDEQFIPEAVNAEIAYRASQIFVRQRMEGENDLITLTLALVTELENFDFSKSFFGNFAVANAVSELVMESLGVSDLCCGQ